MDNCILLRYIKYPPASSSLATGWGPIWKPSIRNYVSKPPNSPVRLHLLLNVFVFNLKVDSQNSAPSLLETPCGKHWAELLGDSQTITFGFLEPARSHIKLHARNVFQIDCHSKKYSQHCSPSQHISMQDRGFADLCLLLKVQ